MSGISNNSGEVLTNKDGHFIEPMKDVLSQETTGFETSLRFITENRREKMKGLWGVNNYINTLGLYSSFDRIWFIHNSSPSDALVEWKGGSSLTSSGDHTYSSSGISGDGTYEFDTAYNPNTRVTDINNWAFGIYSQTDDDTGLDFGCGDGVNEHFIKCKDAGNFVVKNGTTEIDTGAVGNGKGHFACVTSGGTVKAYKNGIEQGTSAAVGGSLANQNMYVGALNNSSTAEQWSAKTYSSIWVYDGALTDDQVYRIDQAVRSIQDIYNRTIL